MVSLATWRWSEGSVSADTVATPRVEAFYGPTILFSQMLGTALGDWLAGSDRGGLGLGYEYGALVVGACLTVIAGAYLLTNIPQVLLFWIAFILTRPLGATLGDLLDKPLADSGLAISRFYAPSILTVLIVTPIVFRLQKAGEHPDALEQDA